MTVTVQHNQTLLDVVVQHCGTLEATMQVMLANNRSLTDLPQPGEQLNIPDGTITNPPNISYYEGNNITIATRAEG